MHLLELECLHKIKDHILEVRLDRISTSVKRVVYGQECPDCNFHNYIGFVSVRVRVQTE